MKSIIDGIGLSVQELLTIIIPGLLACFFLTCVPLIKLELNIFEVNESSWISGVLLFGFSYFLGYVVYVSSSFLDNFYDWIKMLLLRPLDPKVKLVSSRCDEHLDYIDPNKKLNFFIFRWLFPYLIDTYNLTVKVASLKNQHVGFQYPSASERSHDNDRTVPKNYNLMNAYQYAFRKLMADNPLMFDEVQRYYATAKFFRSMTLVLFVGIFIWWIFGDPIELTVWITLSCIISFFVFLNRWRKANHVAFKNLIVLHGSS